MEVDDSLPPYRHLARGRRFIARSWIGLLMLAGGILLGDPAPSSPDIAAAVGLRFTATEHDFGRVRGGELLHHAFVFTNLGPEVVELAGVQASCSCVVLGRWPSRIGPGETGAIPFEFFTVSYRGPVSETITVTESNPARPPVVLRLQADIWRPIEVWPAGAVFEYFPDDPAKSTFTVRIISQIEDPLELSAPVSSQAALSAELSPVVPGREFDLTVHVAPPASPANVVGKITLKTSADSMPLLEIPVHARAPAPVSFSPRSLSLPAGPLATPLSRFVEIRNYSPNPLTLEAPTVNLKGVSLTLSETKPGKRFTLTVDLAAGFTFPAEGKAEITLKSTHPQYPVLRIPLLLMTPADTRAPATPDR